VDELVTIMQTQAELLYENNKISDSLTAGLVSRLTYAMQSKIDGDVDYFLISVYRIQESSGKI
jgi:hypothetical protein